MWQDFWDAFIYILEDPFNRDNIYQSWRRIFFELLVKMRYYKVVGLQCLVAWVATLETFSMLKPLTFHATNWAHIWWQTFWSICRHLHCVCPAGGSTLSRCWEPTRCNLGMGPIARSGELSIKYKYSVTLWSVRSGHKQSYVDKK